MKAGKLDRRVTIRRKTTEPDAYGEEIETWADLATVWGGKYEPRAGETVDAGEVRAANTDARVRIRHSSVFTPTPLDRMALDGIEYDITGVREIQRRRGWEIDGQARADGPKS